MTFYQQLNKETMKQIPLKEITTLIEYKGDVYTPEELAILWNVDYNTFMVTVPE